MLRILIVYFAWNTLYLICIPNARILRQQSHTLINKHTDTLERTQNPRVCKIATSNHIIRLQKQPPASPLLIAMMMCPAEWHYYIDMYNVVLGRHICAACGVCGPHLIGQLFIWRIICADCVWCDGHHSMEALAKDARWQRWWCHMGFCADYVVIYGRLWSIVMRGRWAHVASYWLKYITCVISTLVFVCVFTALWVKYSHYI